VPSAIRLNMFRLRFTKDAQPRTKNGQPAQSTTGLASTHCSQTETPAGTTSCRCSQGRWAPIASTITGTVSTTLTQKRRVMSMRSGFGPASAVIAKGSSAMPQIGQLPGPFRRRYGCIGQV